MKKRQKKIVLLVFDRCQILDFAGAAQVFTSANRFVGDGVASFSGYDVQLIATDSSVVTETGIQVNCARLPKRLEKGSTLLIVGGPGITELCTSEEVGQWFSKALANTDRWGAICSGSLALAAWGLLDGKQATTHWEHLDELACFPTISVERDSLYVIDGQIWTSAGISAGIDMALAMVSEDAGPIVSAKTAQQMVLATKRSGSQTQYSDILRLNLRDPQGDFSALHEWLQANISRPIALEDMASFCATSVRTLQRRYKAALGTSPSKTLKKLRLEKARNLLQTTDTAVTLIARESGFNSLHQFSKEFSKVFGVSPRQFRSR